MQPVVAPVLVVPIGEHWLIESRADIRGFIAPQNGNGPYQARFFDTLEYAQVDFLALPRMTITAGRFLTPFNTYNERLSAVWIRKFSDAPIVDPIGIMNGYSDGGMLRGALASTDSYQISYAAYFALLSTVPKIISQRSTGARSSVFFPKHRLEIGGSYSRKLQAPYLDFEGAFFYWQPPAVPIDIKSEYAHAPGGDGYWLQGGYKLSQSRHAVLRRLEAIARVQQFERLKPISDGLPAVNTLQVDAGADYSFPHEVMLVGTYGRISGSTDRNLWEFSLTYRFLFPL